MVYRFCSINYDHSNFKGLLTEKGYKLKKEMLKLDLELKEGLFVSAMCFYCIINYYSGDITPKGYQ
jgi:hypothetical protein